MWLLSTCRMDLSLETRAGGTHRVSFGAGWLQQPSPWSSRGGSCTHPQLVAPQGPTGDSWPRPLPADSPAARHTPSSVAPASGAACRTGSGSPGKSSLEGEGVSVHSSSSWAGSGLAQGDQQGAGSVFAEPWPWERRGTEIRGCTQEPDGDQAGEGEHHGQDKDPDPLEGPRCPGGFGPHGGTCNTEEDGSARPGSAWHPHLSQLPPGLPLPLSRSEAESCKPERKTS